MARSLVVTLHGTRVGELEQTDTGRLRFSYDADYVDARGAPLSLSLPLRADAFGHRECEPFFGGLLPEEGARERVARFLGVSAANDFALLEEIGGECAGAVSFLPPEASIDPAARSASEPEPLTDERLAQFLDELPRRPLIVGGELRLSLAGAQDKAAVCLVENRIALPMGHEPTTHILKTPIERFEGTVVNELVCMRAAAALGLPTSNVERRVVRGREFLLVERYDRESSPSGVRRLHQEDLCQALGRPTRIKYQAEGGPSLPDAFALLTRASARPALDRLTLLRATVFNVLVGNADAHAKNFSLLYSDGNARLAPLYDVLSTAVYPDLSPRLAMKIGSKAAFDDIRPRHWEQLATDSGLAPSQVRREVSEMCDAVPRALDAAVDALSDDERAAAVVGRIEDEVAFRCEVTRGRLGG